MGYGEMATCVSLFFDLSSMCKVKGALHMVSWKPKTHPSEFWLQPARPAPLQQCSSRAILAALLTPSTSAALHARNRRLPCQPCMHEVICTCCTCARQVTRIVMDGAHHSCRTSTPRKLTCLQLRWLVISSFPVGRALQSRNGWGPGVGSHVPCMCLSLQVAQGCTVMVLWRCCW